MSCPAYLSNDTNGLGFLGVKVFAFRLDKKKLLATLVVVLGAIVVLLCGLAVAGGSGEKKASAGGGDDTQRVAFLLALGWEPQGAPLEITEVQIPEVFDEVYAPYNTMQQENGFDLTHYKGRRVKRFTYKITNYPGGSENVRANLLVCDGVIIGGDIYASESGGFMIGLQKK
jgi:hypothetical protein